MLIWNIKGRNKRFILLSRNIIKENVYTTLRFGGNIYIRCQGNNIEIIKIQYFSVEYITEICEISVKLSRVYYFHIMKIALKLLHDVITVRNLRFKFTIKNYFDIFYSYWGVLEQIYVGTIWEIY